MIAYPVGAVARYDRNMDRAQEALDALPKPAVRLLDAARSSGALWALQWQEDSGGSAFVEFRIGRHGQDAHTEVRASWHTRDTGTLRLFSCIQRKPGRGWHDASLTKAIATITEGTDPTC